MFVIVLFMSNCCYFIQHQDIVDLKFCLYKAWLQFCPIPGLFQLTFKLLSPVIRLFGMKDMISKICNTRLQHMLITWPPIGAEIRHFEL